MSQRPQDLVPLFASLTTLGGIGPKLETAFDRLLHIDEDASARIIDLLLHLPASVIDRRPVARLSDLALPAIFTADVTVDRLVVPKGGSRAPIRVYVHTDHDDLMLAFFNADRRWIERRFPVGEVRTISGRADLYDGMAQIVHPDHVADPARGETVPELDVVYPRTADLSGGRIRAALAQALERLPVLPEWTDPALLTERDWQPFGDALRTVHLPGDLTDADPAGSAWSRLAYDELFAGQLALALVRRRLTAPKGRARSRQTILMDAAIGGLGYRLTGAQMRSLDEIREQMDQPERMLRLLQGDVGSGKTAVAFLAMVHAAEHGAQSAFMAPTELLARQHLATLARMAEPVGIKTVLLTGREKSADRAKALEEIAGGEATIVVGTHALFQSSVAFHDLGLVVVDEQHRFGVHQRLDLAAKGENPDLLVMSATPIPRTLLLTYYGDTDVSRIDEKPADRLPIDTRAVPADRIDDVVDGLRRAIQTGARIYWVCPLVEESDKIEAVAAETRYERLKPVFGDRVGLIHGRMASGDKDAVISSFRDGGIDVLVATTVVEVGVDVPEATIMVVEEADRFGLAQLHQLRGRVGRGDKPSTCILVYRPPLNETARARLNILRETNDGFRIAEEDLKLRGGGDPLGVRQSGLPAFRVVRPEHHLGLIEIARRDARLLLEKDPDLTSERGLAARYALHLFGRIEATRNLDTG